MELFGPVQGASDQKVGYLRTAIIEDECSPVRMAALPRIRMFIDTGPVKLCHSPGIPREMRRNPVKDDADSL